MWDKWFILFFISSAVWGNAVDGIRLPFIGSLFPLRIAILLFVILVWYKTYIIGEPITVLQNSPFRGPRLRNLTLYTFLVMMVTGLLTMYWAYNQMAVIVDLVTWVTSFACIAISLSFLKKRENIIFAAGIYIINYLIIGGIGIYESFTGDYFNLPYEFYTRQTNVFDLYMPASIMMNINNLAIFMVLSMPICFIGTTNLKAKGLIDLLLMAFGGFVIVLTGCNTALLLLCAVLLMYVIMDRKRKTAWLIIAVIAMILIAFGSVVANVFYELINYSAGNEPRLEAWKNIIGVSWKYYFMGVGPGNGTTVNILYKVNSTAVGAAHNYVLTVFEEFGFIAAIMFVFWLGKMIYNMIVVYRGSKDSLMKYALMFFIIFVPSTICMSTMVGYFYYWAEFGLLMALAEIVEKEQLETENIQLEREVV